MLSVKKTSNKSFIKLVASVAAIFSMSAIVADQKPAIELAQLSEGFNPEQKYMA